MLSVCPKPVSCGQVLRGSRGLHCRVAQEIQFFDANCYTLFDVEYLRNCTR